MPDVVAVERRAHATVVSLTRGAKLNAISEQMERELCDAVSTPEVREAPCVVFTGGPDVFSAGADLNEWRDYTPAEIMASYRATGDFAERVADLPMPTLCAVAGWCVGGGLELAVATDFRIAEPSARFRLPEVALGILPSWGGTQRLVRLLGPARAKEVILLREQVDADEALRLGLVTEVVGEGASLARALELAERLSALPRLAVSVTRQGIEAPPATARSAGRGPGGGGAAARGGCGGRPGSRRFQRVWPWSASRTACWPRPRRPPGRWRNGGRHERRRDDPHRRAARHPGAGPGLRRPGDPADLARRRRGRHRGSPGSLAQGGRARPHRVHAAGRVRGCGHDRLPDLVHRPGGALPRVQRDRQPDHLQRLLRRARPGAGRRRAETAVALAAGRGRPAVHGAGHHRAPVRLGRGLHPHPGPPGRRRLCALRAEGLDLQRRHRPLLRGVRDGQAGHRLPRGHRVPGVRRRPGP